MVRSFIAIEIPEKIRTEIEIMLNQFAKADFSVKWVKRDNLHITLLFLGDASREFIESGCQQLESIIKTQKPFELSLSDIGAFPNQQQPRIIWLGVEKGVDQITELQAKIENGFTSIGFKPEARKFHPHLTIGRVKFRFTNPKVFETTYQSEDFLVKSVALFKSTLYPSGPIYERIKEFQFG